MVEKRERKRKKWLKVDDGEERRGKKCRRRCVEECRARW